MSYWDDLIGKKVENYLDTQDLGKVVVNSGGVDRGLNKLNVNLTDNRQSPSDYQSLDNLIKVERTVKNYRKAVDIDTTLSSSIYSIVIIANMHFDIKKKTGVDQEALDHIKKKAGLTWDTSKPKLKHIGWNLSALIDEFNLKNIMDGKTFIRKYFPTEKTINTVDFLAYDEADYDFIEIKDPESGEIDGYMQKAPVYEIPKDWRTKDFNELLRLNHEVKSIPFEADEIIHTKFMEYDNQGHSLVARVLDDVWAIKKIKNMGPDAVRKASLVTAVEVGNENVQIQPFEKTDDPAVKQQKVNAEMNKISVDFAEKDKKETIVHPYGVKPYMLGSGEIIDLPKIINMYRQEIRQGILTPDSKFESAKGSRFTAEQQLSGDMGQTTVINYLQDLSKFTFETKLIDHELILAGYEDAVGGIYIDFTPPTILSEFTLSQIAESIENLRFNIPSEVMVSQYFPTLQKGIEDYKAQNPDFELEQKEKQEPPGFLKQYQTPEKDEETDPEDSGVLDLTAKQQVNQINFLRNVIRNGGIL